MDQDKDGYYKVSLHHVGISPLTGIMYSENVLQTAINELKRRPNQRLFGESSNPNLRATEAELRAAKLIPEALIRHEARVRLPARTMNISLDRVTHAINVQSMVIENGIVTAHAKPFGGVGQKIWPLVIGGFVGFSMRGLVSYKNGNTTEPYITGNKIVETCQIITFDLCNNHLKIK